LSESITPLIAIGEGQHPKEFHVQWEIGIIGEKKRGKFRIRIKRPIPNGKNPSKALSGSKITTNTITLVVVVPKVKNQFLPRKGVTGNERMSKTR